MNFVIFPMFFASSALYPLWRVKEASLWLWYACELNPFTHAVELIRFASTATGQLAFDRDRGGLHRRLPWRGGDRLRSGSRGGYPVVQFLRLGPDERPL